MAQNYIDSQNNFIPVYGRLPRNGVIENSIIYVFFSGSLDWVTSSEFSTDEGRGYWSNLAIKSHKNKFLSPSCWPFYFYFVLWIQGSPSLCLDVVINLWIVI